MSRRLAFRIGVPAVGLAIALAGATTWRVAGYAPAKARPSEHRPEPAAPSNQPGEVRLGLGTIVPGYLSPLGLPPVRGSLTVTDSGLIFSSVSPARSTQLPGPVRSTVSLGYVDDRNGTPVYVFRVDAGVFQTEVPGPLLDLAADPGWLDSLVTRERLVALSSKEQADSASWKTAQEIASSSYADSLYSLFGRPTAPVGLIGPRGRAAGRLGEYIASKDSLALDPGRITGEAQLRHAVAHELAHRWQAKSPGQLDSMWHGVPPIRDPKRYGHADNSEHQAEAVAFAISFLQTTASAAEPAASALTLLDYYELLVPGTRALVRYLSLQPIYADHPLRTALVGSQLTYSGN